MVKNMRVSNKAILLVSLVLVSLLSISTLAYFIAEDQMINVINTGSVDIKVDENFNPPDNWDGSKHTKEVSIKNESKSPALIRVNITPRWEDENGKPYLGDTNLVKLNFVNLIAALNEVEYPINDNKWVKGNDGYYYYNTVVETGVKTNKILDSVELVIPDDLKEIYDKKKLKIDVKAEAIQATTDAHRAAWPNIKNDSNIQKMLDKMCAR